MGIKDEYHQQGILVCRDELTENKQLSHIDDSSNDTPASLHKLRNLSFQNAPTCDKCNYLLRGFVHQGQVCQGENTEQ